MASGKSVSDTLRAVFLQSYGTLNGPVTEKDAERLNSFPLRKHLAGHPEYLYLLFVPVYLLCFTLVERLVPPEGGYWVSWTPLDDRIPFFESFVVPYCAWYPLLFGVGLELLRSDVPGFKSYMHFLMLGFGFSLLFCLAFPSRGRISLPPSCGESTRSIPTPMSFRVCMSWAAEPSSAARSGRRESFADSGGQFWRCVL